MLLLTGGLFSNCIHKNILISKLLSGTIHKKKYSQIELFGNKCIYLNLKTSMSVLLQKP